MVRRTPHLAGRIPLTDAALAVVLCVVAAGGLLSGQVHERPLAITLPVAVVSTLALAVRTRLPLAVTVLISALALAQSLFAGHSSNTLWALVVFLVVAYTSAAACDERRALIGIGVLLGSQFLCEWHDHGSDYAFDTLVFGGVWLFGRGTRSWRTQAVYAQQHREDLARIAVGQERTRIARELHDVVAHSLGVIAVQADAAEAALLKDPSRAGAPMRAIRDSARNALDDMRQLLHVLRADGRPADLTPARGLGDLADLVATMRAAGLPVEMEISPVPSVSDGTELAAYRIAQEGLTNVRKHAGDVPTRLRVEPTAGRLRVEVHNDAPAGHAPAPDAVPSTGHGLIGVRERVLAAGGTLDAGPTATGGFSLVATLPLQETR
ncbi:MAG TPA: histidine kinase [Marmoricola sp.]